MKLKSFVAKFITACTMATILVTAPLSIQTEAAGSIESKELISVANNLIGTKYVYGGTTAKGFDCSGFIGYVYKELGLNLPRTSAGMYATGTKVSYDNLQPGDLVFFNTSGRGVSHAGIYIGAEKFVHSSSSKGVSIARLDDPYYWGARYIGAKRVASVNVVAAAKK
ncbi:C40 family peptidase [Paenisporosarcina sp. NPDC076898]|uniref:C40 family peptidase n=1 Tax=unclassified Paenisporosarcina TaxID=2642018 RepID=UPI003D0678D4